MYSIGPGTAFDSDEIRKHRLHHRDETPDVGPSSASFGKRNLVGLMGVMMAAIGGDGMKTIKAISATGNCASIKNAFSGGSIGANKNYVLKSSSTGGIVQYSLFFFQTDANGDIAGWVIRMPGYNVYASTFTGTAKISVGDEFYELDRPY